MIFNNKKPSITPIYNIDFQKLKYLNKYRLTPINKVYSENSNLVKKLLDSAPLTNRYKKILVDIKVQKLDINTYSCIKGWHLDGRLNTDHNGDKNTYHILIYGGAATEFIGCPISLDNNITNQKELVKYIPKDIEVYTLPQYVWNTYGERDWHRGVNSNTPVTRTFIRICETNYMR